MSASQARLATLTRFTMQASQTQPAQPLFDFYPQITLIKHNYSNQDHPKTILRPLQTTLKPPQDHTKTPLRQLKQIKQFLLIKQFQLTKQIWQN